MANRDSEKFSDAMTDVPLFPTYISSRHKGDWREGVTTGVSSSGGVGSDRWLWRSVPMSPVADAKTVADLDNAAAPIMSAFYELGTMARNTSNRRSLSKATYRKYKVLVINLPQWWIAPYEHPLSDYYTSQFFAKQETRARCVMFGVQLRDSLSGTEDGIKGIVHSITSTITEGGIPLGDFAKDAREVGSALERAGLVVPSANDFKIAGAWWNNGQHPDVHVLPSSDCVHIFATPAQAQRAAAAIREGNISYEDIAPSRTITMAAVSDFTFDFTPTSDPSNWWVTDLINQDALVVSVTGSVEPSALTRQELRRQRKRNEEDQATRARSGRAAMVEQGEHIGLLQSIEDVYAVDGPPPTLTDTVITVGFNGYVEDLSQLSQSIPRLSLAPLTDRQRAAMAETMMCSPVRANWYSQDAPAHVLAYSGAPGLSLVGDQMNAKSVLMGFSENDKQPIWFDPMSAHDQDTLPLMLVAGATGSGKSVFGLWLLYQLGKMDCPSIFIDPKQGSDHSAAIMATGRGRVYSLDDITRSDGAFDPIRFSITPEDGIAIASSMLASINPWGPDKDRYEIPVLAALQYGVSRGAKCVGQALKIAYDEKQVPREIVEPVFTLARTLPQFRACFGVNPEGEGLRAFEGITLIQVGNSSFDLPDQNIPMDKAPVSQRASVTLLRMMVFGSAAALNGRDGVVAFDEAWVFLGAGRAEMERLGRLARSQRVSPILFTQRVTDAVNAGLRGYLSRGVILPIEDEEEARAACELFKIEQTPERIARITGKATMGGVGGSVEPNWGSLRALYEIDKETGRKRNVRGSVGLVADVAGRVVPVEFVLPPDFLKIASTNKEEINARKASQEARAHSVQAQAQSSGRRDTTGSW